LLAGGDVGFGQLRGQRLLREPGRNDFEPLRALFGSADLRFVNLESQLSEQHGQTVSPNNPLVFTGPPGGADALARAGIDIVSVANNHAWDYGEVAFVETLTNLERVRVAYVGAGQSSAQAAAPRVLEHDGFRVAFVAVTGIWNQGPLASHPARDHVARATREALVQAVRQARAEPGVDAVVVSFHGGEEYVDFPLEPTRALLRAAIDAGADVVLGHHPHVVQRVELVHGRPVFYSLGNLLMRMTSGQPWTEVGILARVRLARGRPPEPSVCPFRIDGLEPVPLAADPRRTSYEAFFRARFESLLRVAERMDPPSALDLGPFGADGCAALVPRANVPPLASSPLAGR
jgi:poly-gamma-glutamate capsule biosynthesis protein CapA/YwtB (metallophosphatase superfamily)